jgi:hypothetical protein
VLESVGSLLYDVYVPCLWILNYYDVACVDRWKCPVNSPEYLRATKHRTKRAMGGLRA